MNNEDTEFAAEAAEMKVMSVPKSLIFIVIGIAGITLGSDGWWMAPKPSLPLSVSVKISSV